MSERLKMLKVHANNANLAKKQKRTERAKGESQESQGGMRREGLCMCAKILASLDTYVGTRSTRSPVTTYHIPQYEAKA